MSGAATLPAEILGPTRHLFLSPHYDDIPLSAGGTVRLLADHGRPPETLVVFGSDPDPSHPLTPFARSLHDAWGLDAQAVIASRRAEEAAAAAILGATTGVLPFRDAIYRGALYLSDDDLFAAPSAREAALPAEVAAALGLPSSPNRATRVYAPLGIGRHVDHQHVFRAAASLADSGWDVWFYEDVPYALKLDAVAARFADVSASIRLAPAALVPIASSWDAKIEAIMRYPSQLETIFRAYVGVGTSRDEIAAALAGYAASVGEGALAERFWRVADPSTAAKS